MVAYGYAGAAKVKRRSLSEHNKWYDSPYWDSIGKLFYGQLEKYLGKSPVRGLETPFTKNDNFR